MSIFLFAFFFGYIYVFETSLCTLSYVKENIRKLIQDIIDQNTTNVFASKGHAVYLTYYD